jgi:beta-glucanase (GH16 family)
MSRSGVAVAVLGLLMSGGPLPCGAAGDAPAWNLIWQDEFEGAQLDPAKWDCDIGNGFYAYDAKQWISGWGNNELQYYTRDPGNVFVKDGLLHLRAVKESLHGCGYTSARIKSRRRDGAPLFQHTYGRYEIRAKLPLGRGLWPALWMLPQEERYGGWAASGEIDILEARGQEPTKVLGTLHFGSRWPANASAGGETILTNGTTIADFHVYALEWEPGAIRWYLDGRCYATQTNWWSSSRVEGGKGAAPRSEADLNPWPAPFDQPFHLIMNLAVGGRLLGPPEATTPFPAELLVDYVRVYDKVGGYGPPGPRPAGGRPGGGG